MPPNMYADASSVRNIPPDPSASGTFESSQQPLAIRIMRAGYSPSISPSNGQ